MKKVAVMLGNGFEEIEALTCVDVLRRAGFTCDMISVSNSLNVKSAHGIEVIADKVISEELDSYDMIICPGGLPGADNLADSELLIKTIREFDKREDRYIAAICASPAIVLSRAGIEKNRYITSYPGEDFENMLDKANYVEELVVVDGNLITSRGPRNNTFICI